MSLTFPKIILRKIAWICYGVQLCLLRMMRWLAYQSWSPIGQESDKIIGNHFDIWHSQLTEYIHINLWCGFWQGGVHESLQIRMWSNSTKQNLSVTPFIVIVICNDIVISAMSAIQSCQSFCVFLSSRYPGLDTGEQHCLRLAETCQFFLLLLFFCIARTHIR